MKLTVVKVSEVTKNGNIILTLQGEGAKVDTPFGEKTPKFSFCMSVTAGTEKEVGFSADIDLNKFNQVVRPFPSDEGVMVDCTWLHLKA